MESICPTQHLKTCSLFLNIQTNQTLTIFAPFPSGPILLDHCRGSFPFVSMLRITEIVQRILRFVFRDKTIARCHLFFVLNLWNTVEGDVALFALFLDIV